MLGGGGRREVVEIGDPEDVCVCVCVCGWGGGGGEEIKSK